MESRGYRWQGPFEKVVFLLLLVWAVGFPPASANTPSAWAVHLSGSPTIDVQAITFLTPDYPEGEEWPPLILSARDEKTLEQEEDDSRDNPVSFFTGAGSAGRAVAPDRTGVLAPQWCVSFSSRIPLYLLFHSWKYGVDRA